MIVDEVKNISSLLPHVAGRLKTALEFLQRTDLNELTGTFAIEGQHIYAAVNEYSTEPRKDKKAETHIKHIDIQVAISGAERVYTHLLSSKLPVLEDLRESKDAVFYDVCEIDSHILSGECFAVYFPWDVHRPGCDVVDGTSNKVRKLVIKVLTE